MRLLFAALVLFPLLSLKAQTGCPGCVVNLPPTLAADTVYLPPMPDGQVGIPYNKDISFRMPKTTTPVHSVDSTTPPGLTISSIEIVSVEGLPPGLFWTPNQFVFEVATQTDGCIKLCGTPSVSDSFTVVVRIKAKVLFITQESQFTRKIYIQPKVSITEGFTLTNASGCGSVTVGITNNIPSNGADGFSYSWNFGDNTASTEENPPAHTYNNPGKYPIKYRAIVDTAGYTLESIKVLSVECVDQLGAGKPDLYVYMKSPNGSTIFDSSPDVDNTPLPYTFPVNKKIGEGNYSIEVWDEDSGLKGSDDLCGNISFNYLSNDTITAGGFTVVLTIVHPVDTINAQDTVVVFPLPALPLISAPKGLTVCQGQDTVILQTKNVSGLQWYLDGNLISGAVDSVYTPAESGVYTVQVTTPDGCTAVSAPAAVTIHATPAAPGVAAPNGLTVCEGQGIIILQTAPLAGLQWLKDGAPVAGAINAVYSPTESGAYAVRITSPEGCSAVSTTLNAVVNPTPATPVITAPNGLKVCLGQGVITLQTSAAAALQWFKNGTPLAGATGNQLTVSTESGNYSVASTNPEGCTAVSAGVQATVNPLPSTPLFENVNNSLRLKDTTSLPAQYALQWYKDGSPIPGETGFRYCAKVSAAYGLQVTDLATGCISFYTLTIIHNPAFDCTVSAEEIALSNLRVYPNPAGDFLWIDLEEPLSEKAVLVLRQSDGKIALSKALAAGMVQTGLELNDLPAGMYLLEMRSEKGVATAKVVVE